MMHASRVHVLALVLGPALLLGTSVWLHPPQDRRPSDLERYAEHPPLAHTGGFGEPTCHACHFGGEVNGGEGTLSIEGLPRVATPGRSYPLTVRLSASMARSGFMMALRHPDGTQAGRMIPGDTSRVSVHTVDSTGVQYAHHTLAGTAVSDAETAWSLRWTAPETIGDSVRVHVSANAANDDASEFGDDVYTAFARTVVADE